MQQSQLAFNGGFGPSQLDHIPSDGAIPGQDLISALSHLPTSDPRYILWTEWIKLKTKSFELQIAEARQKEREAEVELQKLKRLVEPAVASTINEDMARVLGLDHGMRMNLGLPETLYNTSFPSTSYPTQQTISQPMYDSLKISSTYDQTYAYPDPQPMTAFDLQALASQEEMFTWLPNLETTPSPKPSTAKPEKRIVMDYSSNCITCDKLIARILLRAPRSQIQLPVKARIQCTTCAGVPPPSPITSIGSIESRKRIRLSLEDEVGDQVFCDVCQRVQGKGHVFGAEDLLDNISEVICFSCDTKYQRCTDCGGGGGPRVGIGKWRLKQVFQPGRKTCTLSHSRLGDRPREIGIHCPQTDFTPDQLKEVLSRCKALWSEKTLSRLAVPEMLEIDLPPNYINPLKTYQDVAEIVENNWPTRQALFDEDVPDQFKRLLGLTWAHSRPRRSAKTVDIEEYGKSDRDDMSTVLDNVKKTNVVIPAGSELIGMWGGEWDMKNGSLLISSFYPFEGTDGEDLTALSVGELITHIQGLQQSINASRAEKDKIPPCEHLWVVSGGTLPLVRERMADILVRKRSFVHVDEYLTRYPDFIHALRARPYGLQQDTSPKPDSKPLVLARWLGKGFDAEKILEIKQLEFGGKAKKRKR